MSKPLRLPEGITVIERGWLSANNILLRNREQAALIDSGYITHATQTLALVEHALNGQPLDHLLNTHLHSDHCGGNASLQARYRPVTWIPAASADAVAAWDEEQLSYRSVGQNCARFTYDRLLHPGDALQLAGGEWQVLASPGHDPRSVVFYNPQHMVLASADALWENGFGVVFPELEGEPAFDAVRETLDMIAGLDVEIVIPGHGRPFGDVQGALERAYQRLDFLASDPMRHAQYASKVLVKFKLMEQRQMSHDALLEWIAETRLMRLLGERFFDVPPAALAQSVLEALVKAGAVELRNGQVCDREN